MDAFPITLKYPEGGGGANVVGCVLPEDVTLVAVTGHIDSVTGAVTALDVDVNVAGSALSGWGNLAWSAFTAGATMVSKSKHYGGSIDPADIAGGSRISLDVDRTGGTSVGVTVTLWCLHGKKG